MTLPEPIRLLAAILDHAGPIPDEWRDQALACIREAETRYARIDENRRNFDPKASLDRIFGENEELFSALAVAERLEKAQRSATIWEFRARLFAAMSASDHKTVNKFADLLALAGETPVLPPESKTTKSVLAT